MLPGISTCSRDKSLSIKIGIQQRASVKTMKKKRLANVISFLMWLWISVAIIAV